MLIDPGLCWNLRISGAEQKAAALKFTLVIIELQRRVLTVDCNIAAFTIRQQLKTSVAKTKDARLPPDHR